MANEVRIESRPWKPQDLIDDIQLMIDEEPDNYLNGNRTTLCMAKDYLEKFFAEESLRPKGRWIDAPDMDEFWGELVFHKCSLCDELQYIKTNFCPNCGADMREGGE